MSLPQQQSMLSCQRSLSTALGKVSQSATSMSGFARGMIDSVNQAWEEIGWFIAQMAVEIAIEIGLGALLGMVTFGAGAAAMAAKIALTVTRWALKIAALCKKLRMLVMAALRAARLAIRGGAMVIRETLSAGLASAITTVSFNTVRGALDPNFQPQNVLNAALSAAAGGAAGGGVSRIGAGRLTDNVMNNGLRRATHIGVETTGGAIDGLVSGAAESGLNGTAFSPLSSMAAGALLGGALSGRPGGASGPQLAHRKRAGRRPVHARRRQHPERRHRGRLVHAERGRHDRRRVERCADPGRRRQRFEHRGRRRLGRHPLGCPDSWFRRRRFPWRR